MDNLQFRTAQFIFQHFGKNAITVAVNPMGAAAIAGFSS
jgi:hypothetical protein